MPDDALGFKLLGVAQYMKSCFSAQDVVAAECIEIMEKAAKKLIDIERKEAQRKE